MKKREKVKNEELRTYFYDKSIVKTFRKGRPTLTPLKNRKRQKERNFKNTKTEISDKDIKDEKWQ